MGPVTYDHPVIAAVTQTALTYLFHTDNGPVTSADRHLISASWLHGVRIIMKLTLAREDVQILQSILAQRLKGEMTPFI